MYGRLSVNTVRSWQFHLHNYKVTRNTLLFVNHDELVYISYYFSLIDMLIVIINSGV